MTDAGLSEVRQDSFLWVGISRRYSAIGQSGLNSGFLAAVVMGHNAVGAALIFAGVGSMAAAAVVLLVPSPDKARAALTQATFR